jgi:hypothetical protein
MQIMVSKVFADFQNTDAHGRVRLNCNGTLRDLAAQQIDLHDGVPLTLYDNDEDATGHAVELQAAGVATYSADENCWVAVVDWQALRRIPLRANQAQAI